MYVDLVRLISDPESRQAGSSNVCKFRVVKNKKRGDKEVSTFLDCEAWGKTGEFIQSYFKKGSKMLVTGELEQENWADKNDGSKRSKIVVKVLNAEFGDSAPKKEDKVEDTSDVPQDDNVPF